MPKQAQIAASAEPEAVQIVHVPTAAELRLDIQHAYSAAINASSQLMEWRRQLLPIHQQTPYESSLESADRKLDQVLYLLRQVSEACQSCSNDDVIQTGDTIRP